MLPRGIRIPDMQLLYYRSNDQILSLVLDVSILDWRRMLIICKPDDGVLQWLGVDPNASVTDIEILSHAAFCDICRR